MAFVRWALVVHTCLLRGLGSMPRLEKVMIRREVGEGHEMAASISPARNSHAEQKSSLIPNRIVLNYKTNLLKWNGVELPEHKQNLNRSLRLHPGAEILFYDDSACRAAIARVHSEGLARSFDREDVGMYKSDLCRLAQLYEHGGYYFDNDLELLQDVRKIVPPNVTLTSAIEFQTPTSVNTNLFQAFLGAAPRHPVLKDALDRTFNYYIKGWSKKRALVETAGETSTNRKERVTRFAGGLLQLGPEMMGAAARAWVGADKLKLGYMQHPSTGELAYFFTERTDDVKHKFGLEPRTNGKGCCCNIFVADDVRAIAWSRFVGAGKACQHADNKR